MLNARRSDKRIEDRNTISDPEPVVGLLADVHLCKAKRLAGLEDSAHAHQDFTHGGLWPNISVVNGLCEIGRTGFRKLMLRSTLTPARL